MDSKSAYSKRKDYQDLEEWSREPFKEFRDKLKNKGKEKEKEKTIDLDNVDENGQTVLTRVVNNKNWTEQMWVLLDYGADPNVQDKDGKTALHHAVAAERRDMVICLLLFGADIEKKDNEGNEPLKDYRWEDLQTIQETVESIKREFISLTRKRRKHLKFIFDEIDKEVQSRFININSLSAYYEIINKESNEAAMNDAKLFIQGAKLIKNQFEENPSLTFEEFVIAICKIVKIHGMKVIDDFIDRYKKIRDARIKVQQPKAEEPAEGEGENKE